MSTPKSPIAQLSCAHPWHGVSIGPDAPKVVTAFIEIVPTDVVKYEVDKDSGLLKIDRPHKFSSQCPTLYGFIPRTYCDTRVGKLASPQTVTALQGDKDPLDICILAERPIQHGGVLMRAVPIGGLRLIDRGEADDKIIAVLHEDAVYGAWRDITDCPDSLVRRLTHYFLTYKQMPGEDTAKVEVGATYGSDTARQVIRASQEDYAAHFAEIIRHAGP